MEKPCRRCKHLKSFPEQFRSKMICLECAPDESFDYTAWRAKNDERLAILKQVLQGVPKEDRGWYRQIYRQYGLIPAAYQALMLSQNGLCAICENPPESGRLAVDHDHVTGKVRGLLCLGCNAGLGMFRESPKAIQKALSYLENHS